MRIEIARASDATRITASGRLTYSEVPRLHQALLEAFAAGRGVELELRDEVETDLSLLQLLCAARSTALARGVAFSVAGLAGATQMRRVIAQSGAERCEGCPGGCPWSAAGAGAS